MQDLTLDVGKLKLHAVATGPEEGPLVILLHGFPEFWYCWKHQLEPLAEAGYRVVALDQRGYNLSDKPKSRFSYTLPKLSGDVVGALDALGRQSAYVVGHDWGGAVAWYTATHHPARVDKLMVFNCPNPLIWAKYLLINSEQRRRSWYVYLYQIPILAERYIMKDNFRMLRLALTKTSKPGTYTEEDIEKYVESWKRGDIKSMLAWYRAIPLNPKKEMFSPKRVQVPTKLVWGTRDKFLAKSLAEKSMELCDDGSIHFLEGVSHWVTHEVPDEVTQQIKDFCKTSA